ncbi:hypothetical protein IW967_02740 [Alicyclobacillus mali]|uniref:Uncharacterized protein n=1 Tax=Alicyclobacillus mali (ex Roth et al. 2021) TaxID=1123961 RepID=A0ABS0F0J6_9BACL|nr:hypothetical protein [Alicyclobacillus mali (ex Roth et al. 2021)]MBF8376790.1 hypothetical protein [Alicyclobacillus mali (ex Roth et al. 2021)]
MQNRLFDLDRVFELAKQGRLWIELGYQIRRPFPNLKNIIENYQNTLSKFKYIPNMPLGIGEHYERIIHISIYGYYHLCWDIQKALSIIKKRDIKPIDMPINDLIKTVDVNNLNLSNLHSPHFKPHPVLVAKFPMIPEQFVVIDGNHTVYWAYQHGIVGIKGYLLETQDHLPAMTHNLFRTLFAIHSNIGSIGFFMSQPNATLDDILLYPVPYLI